MYRDMVLKGGESHRDGARKMTDHLRICALNPSLISPAHVLAEGLASPRQGEVLLLSSELLCREKATGCLYGFSFRLSTVTPAQKHTPLIDAASLGCSVS